MPSLTSIAYSAAVLAASAVLIWSGLEKLRNSSPLAAALSQLGIPRYPARVVAVLVPFCELGTVACLVAGTPSYVPAFLLAMLGLSFAGAAIISKLTGRAVPCACFGASQRKLGWPQLLALPVWLFSAWATLHIPSVSPRERLASLACTIIVLAGLRAGPVLRQAVHARSDRRAFVGGA